MPNNPGTFPLKDPQHERYAIARAGGANQQDSYRTCGGTAASASQAATRFEQSEGMDKRISGILAETRRQATAIAAVSRDELIESLRARRTRAQKGTAILAKDGATTGERREDFAAGNRCDEILAKLAGLMVDVTRDEDFDGELTGMNSEAVFELITGFVDQLDPNMRKMVAERIQKEAAAAKEEQADTEDEPASDPPRVLQ